MYWFWKQCYAIFLYTNYNSREKKIYFHEFDIDVLFYENIHSSYSEKIILRLGPDS